jgi:hypothetical protein
VLWVTLTTRNSVQNGQLAYHHKRLRQSLDRQLDFQGVQFVAVRCRGDKNPSLQHLHVLWAWQGSRSFYVPQDWLSMEWERIHGAKIVDIKRVGLTRDDQRKLTRYIVTQYCSDQRGLQRLSWSWWALPVALARGWESMKRLASVSYRDDSAKWGWRREYVFPMSVVVVAWEHLLESGEAFLGDTLLALSGRDVVEIF